MLRNLFNYQVLTDSKKSRKTARTIKKRARNSKNTLIYPGSPFLNGYVQTLTPQ